MRLRPLAPAFLIAVPFVLAACNKGGAGGGDLVASVNGDRITREQYIAMLEHKPTVRIQPSTLQGNGDAAVAGPLGFQAIADLVKNQLILQMAKEEGVAPSDADLNAELQYRVSRQPDFLKRSMDQGFTKEAILSDLRVLLSQERIVTKGVTVPDVEVDRYIKANPREFQEPKMAQLSFIQVSSDDKKHQVDEALNSKMTFATAASQFSEAAGARTNKGVYPQNMYDAFTPALQKLVDTTPEGGTSNWVKEGNSWLKFSVDQKRAAKPIPITGVIKETVKRKLAQVRGQKGSDFGRKLTKKLVSADVKLTNPDYQKLWTQQIEAAKAQESGS